MASTGDLRNIVLLGHAGCGKTSLAEAMLHTAGIVNRLGSVDDGTSVCDYDEEEKERKNSIHSALIHFDHNGKSINVIDTPGFPDFIGPALSSIPAAEVCAVIISASAGIEVNTRKLYNAAENALKPKLIIINKMDSDNVDFEALIQNIQATFGSQCKCVNLPTPDKSGVVDCIAKGEGDTAFSDASTAHLELLESVIEADDQLMEKYLGGDDITPEQVKNTFGKAMRTGTIIPIMFTNAATEAGVKQVMDFFAADCPNPNDFKAKLITQEQATELTADPEGPLAGLVFRVGFDPKSNMKLASIKVFSGTLKTDTDLHRNDEKKGIRPGHVLKFQGSATEDIDAGIAGDIVNLAKIEELQVGDTIHDGKIDGKFEMPKLPQPMFSLAVEPASRGDESKIGNALERLMEEDQCFKVVRDQQTKEQVMSGMGDLHLRVMLSKMEHRFKLKVNTKQPKIPYRETIGAKAEGHYRHKKQSGGAGQFGEVYLRVEPAQRGSDPTLEYSWDIFGGSIPGQYEPAVLKGVNDVMETGAVAGYPLQDVKVSVYDGKYHPVDSKEVAFRMAGKGAFLDAVTKAKPQILEPLVHMEITVPMDNVGDITGDISSRRGRIEGQEVLPGGMIVIKAIVPLSEVKQYDSQLKSVTAGQGSYSMELSHYEPVPPNVQQQIVEQHEKEKAAEHEG